MLLWVSTERTSKIKTFNFKVKNIIGAFCDEKSKILTTGKLIDLGSKYPIFDNTKIQNINKPYVLPNDYTQSNKLLETMYTKEKNIIRRPGEVKLIHFTIKVV